MVNSETYFNKPLEKEKKKTNKQTTTSSGIKIKKKNLKKGKTM